MSIEASAAFPPEFARLLGSVRLAVYLDLKSPYAFIAVGPTRDVARALWVGQRSGRSMSENSPF